MDPLSTTEEFQGDEWVQTRSGVQVDTPSIRAGARAHTQPLHLSPVVSATRPALVLAPLSLSLSRSLIRAMLRVPPCINTAE